jgi:protein-disulfide isomerase
MATRTAATLVVPVNDSDHIDGPADAPVTLVEYGDYECPYCGQAYVILQQLKELFGDQLRVVYRHFPLATIHPHAQSAAEAAEAAGAQRRFWDMHGLLFENQEALEDDVLETYAADIGLDMVRFTHDMTEHRHAARIRGDVHGGIRSGVNGTPAFFINDSRYDGVYDAESLGAAIAEVLGKEMR